METQLSPLFYVALVSTACATPRPSPAPHADEVGVLLERSVSLCSEREPDVDADGISDSCELLLAQAFAPELIVYAGGCNYDQSVQPHRLGGEYYFGVQPNSGGVRVAFLPAYYNDCGWHGLKCWLPLMNCAPHAGDSELIVVDATLDSATNRWRTKAVFLSAHCFGRWAADCRWYRDVDLDRFEWVASQHGGAPVIWVADGRQANYPTSTACDRGHTFVDTCARNRVRYRFPIESQLQNIGSRTYPVGAGGGCVGTDQIGWDSLLADQNELECFWRPDTPFRGWQGGAFEGNATPYARYLDEIVRF